MAGPVPLPPSLATNWPSTPRGRGAVTPTPRGPRARGRADASLPAHPVVAHLRAAPAAIFSSMANEKGKQPTKSGPWYGCTTSRRGFLSALPRLRWSVQACITSFPPSITPRRYTGTHAPDTTPPARRRALLVYSASWVGSAPLPLQPCPSPPCPAMVTVTADGGDALEPRLETC